MKWNVKHMAKYKQMPKKRRLVKRGQQSENIPTWIVMRTKGTIRTSPFSRRHWRSSSLKV